MTNSFVPDGDRDQALADTLSTVVELARRDATPGALAVLRALSVMWGTTVAATAGQAAAELATSGFADRVWVSTLLRPEPTSCLRYGNIDGGQETVLVGFG